MSKDKDVDHGKLSVVVVTTGSNGTTSAIKVVAFKVAAVGSNPPIACLDTERGVILISSDGVTFAGRVNLMFHDVRVGDCVWVGLAPSKLLLWHAIGFNGAERLPDAPMKVSNAAWMMPKNRGKDEERPGIGFYGVKPAVNDSKTITK